MFANLPPAFLPPHVHPAGLIHIKDGSMVLRSIFFAWIFPPMDIQHGSLLTNPDGTSPLGLFFTFHSLGHKADRDDRTPCS